MFRENRNKLELIILIILQREKERDRERQKETERHRQRDTERTDESKIAYNKQQNIWVSLLRKTKRDYLANLDTKIIFGKVLLKRIYFFYQ